MRPSFVFLLALALFGSSCASRDYVCPDPIGKIVRDDCEVYRTRFESLQAKLSARVGLVGASVSLGKKSLRDPSQLLQILAHRTYALCRDFNACRVSSLEYRERRERIDHVFTAVGAINAQLAKELPASEKAALVAKLVSILSDDRPRGRSSPRVRRQGDRHVSRRRGTFYFSWLPWYGTKFLPPQGSGKGPTIGHVRYSLRHVFRSGHGVVGYGLRVRFLLRGKVIGDALVRMRYGTRSVDCRLGRGLHRRNGLVGVSCETPKDEAIKRLTLPLTLLYDAEGEGKAREIGRRVFHALSRVTNPKNGSLTFAQDHDEEARHLRLIFRPIGRLLPPSFERPSLFAVLKLRAYRRRTVTARCWVDGKRLGSAIAAYGRYSGQTGHFQDRDRYRRVAPGKSVSVSHPFVTWMHYDFPLPYYVKHGAQGEVPKDLHPWPVPGRWRCVVSLDGDPVREAHFVVNKDGRLEASSAQGEHPSAAWILDTKVLPSKKEEALR